MCCTGNAKNLVKPGIQRQVNDLLVSCSTECTFTQCFFDICFIYNYPLHIGITHLSSPVGRCLLSVWTGWVYYHVSNAMQYSNTALETTALVMYDPNTLLYVVPFVVMALPTS